MTVSQPDAGLDERATPASGDAGPPEPEFAFGAPELLDRRAVAVAVASARARIAMAAPRSAAPVLGIPAGTRAMQVLTREGLQDIAAAVLRAKGRVAAAQSRPTAIETTSTARPPDGQGDPGPKEASPAAFVEQLAHAMRASELADASGLSAPNVDQTAPQIRAAAAAMAAMRAASALWSAPHLGPSGTAIPPAQPVDQRIAALAEILETVSAMPLAKPVPQPPAATQALADIASASLPVAPIARTEPPTVAAETPAAAPSNVPRVAPSPRLPATAVRIGVAQPHRAAPSAPPAPIPRLPASPFPAPGTAAAILADVARQPASPPPVPSSLGTTPVLIAKRQDEPTFGPTVAPPHGPPTLPPQPQRGPPTPPPFHAERRSGRVLKSAALIGLRLIILAALAVGLVWVLALVSYRFVDPPASTLMLGHSLIGRPIQQRWVPLERISPNLIRAVIASEDGNFCRHRGVDWGAINEAIGKAAEDGTWPRGASTISMQTVKNLLLWPQAHLVRKLLELPLAYIAEKAWGKKRMLELYLNIAEWGPGIFGVEAAAQHYFRKSSTSLTAREASLLAVALPNPIERNASRPGPGMQRVARLIETRSARPTLAVGCLDLQR